MSAILLLSDPVYAATDIHTVLTNLQRIIAPLTLMVLIISYVAGIFFIFRAIILMKKFGSGQQGGELSHPFMYLVVGTILIFLPSATSVTMTSLFGQTANIFSGNVVNYGSMGQGQSLMSYSASSGGGIGQQWTDLANTLVLYMQFLGFLSFVKGWFLVSKAAAPGSQGGNISKGITHIIGGIGLINIVGVVNIFRNTIWG